MWFRIKSRFIYQVAWENPKLGKYIRDWWFHYKFGLVLKFIQTGNENVIDKAIALKSCCSFEISIKLTFNTVSRKVYFDR